MLTRNGIHGDEAREQNTHPVNISDNGPKRTEKSVLFGAGTPSTIRQQRQHSRAWIAGRLSVRSGKIRGTNRSAGAVLVTPPGMVTRRRRSGDMAHDSANPPINFKAIRRSIERERVRVDPFAESWPRTLCRAERDAAWSITNGRCWYCGIQTTRPGTFEVDHVFPKCFGGTNDPKNLVPACTSCNASKAYYTVEEFRANQGIDLFWFEREGIEL